MYGPDMLSIAGKVTMYEGVLYSVILEIPSSLVYE
jgi:hypothetical protein